MEFLQGQFSQDLKQVPAGKVTYGFWLTQKGKVFGDAIVRPESAERCLIASWSLTADALRERLDAYIIADDVELEDQTDAWKGWVIAGEQVCSGSAALPVGEDTVWWQGTEEGALGYVLAKLEPEWPANWTEMDESEWARIRIAVKWPEVPVDLGADDLPQEGGRHEVGVSFNKGCYLGQEVMARLEATGRVRRQLTRVSGNGPMPPGDSAELQQDGKTVGKVRSHVTHPDGGWIGLAMVLLARVDLEKPAELKDQPATRVEFG